MPEGVFILFELIVIQFQQETSIAKGKSLERSNGEAEGLRLKGEDLSWGKSLSKVLLGS